jgi:hypothetical protein
MTATAAPFRDLFIELPATLFDMLRGIGERAVLNASRPAPPASMVPSTLSILERYIVHVMRRYGWIDVRCIQFSSAAAVEIIATGRCGHRTSYRIDEERLFSASFTIRLNTTMLDEVIQNAPRRCYCVQRQETA